MIRRWSAAAWAGSPFSITSARRPRSACPSSIWATGSTAPTRWTTSRAFARWKCWASSAGRGCRTRRTASPSPSGEGRRAATGWERHGSSAPTEQQRSPPRPFPPGFGYASAPSPRRGRERPTLPELPQASRPLTAGAGALAQPVLPVGPVAAASATVGPFRPLFGVEHGDVGQTALFEILQPHPLAAPHLGQFVQREDQGLDVLADGRDMVGRRRLRDAQHGQHVAVQHLFAAPLLGQGVVFRRDEAIAGFRRDQQLPARLGRQDVADLGLL